MLLSGDVQVGELGAGLGDRLKSGDRLKTTEGRAVVSLAKGISLSLGTATDLKVNWEDDSIEVEMGQGQIQAYVEPGMDHPRFGIMTARGRIEVTGTIFSVAAGDDSVQVRVLRGEVEIEDRGGRQRHLGKGGATELGNSKVWTLSSDEEKSLWT